MRLKCDRCDSMSAHVDELNQRIKELERSEEFNARADAIVRDHLAAAVAREKDYREALDYVSIWLENREYFGTATKINEVLTKHKDAK